MNVGAAKPIDGLLRIADEVDDASPGSALEECAAEDRPLRLVGVLKFVDERVSPATAHRLGQRRAARPPQGFVHQREHVLEVIEAGFALATGELVANGGQDHLDERGGKRRRQRGEVEGGRAEVPRRAGRRRALPQGLEVREIDGRRPHHVARRIARLVPLLHPVGHSIDSSSHGPGALGLYPEALNRGDDARLSRLVDGESLERAFEFGHTKVGYEPAVGCCARPQEPLDAVDRAPGVNGHLEPGGPGGIGGDAFPQRLAKRTRERVAPVDLLLFEEAPAVERVLAEDTLAKGVDGGDRGRVEPVVCPLELALCRLVDRPEVTGFDLRCGRRLSPPRKKVLDARADANPELARRLFGERHDEHTVERRIRRQEQLDDEMFQRERLAGPCRRLDDRVAIGRDAPQDGRACDKARLHGESSSLSKNAPKRRSIITRASASSGAGCSCGRGLGRTPTGGPERHRSH